MKQRASIALIIGPLALFLIYLGSWYYFLPLAAVLILATIEYTQLIKNMGWHISLLLLLVLAGFQWLLGQWPQPGLWGPVTLLSLLLILAYALWTYEKETSQTVPADWMAATTGLFLLGWLGSHFFLVRNLPEIGWQWTMLAMCSTWIGDSGAYIVGKFIAGNYIIGKHKLSPRLSPNKTIEGYFGGIVFSLVFSMFIAYLINIASPNNIPYLNVLALALLISIITPLGDLGISLLKREAHVKDSGTIFKEHGGALDRIDTLLWAAAIAYYLALFLTR